MYMGARMSSKYPRCVSTQVGPCVGRNGLYSKGLRSVGHPMEHRALGRILQSYWLTMSCALVLAIMMLGFEGWLLGDPRGHCRRLGSRNDGSCGAALSELHITTIAIGSTADTGRGGSRSASCPDNCEQTEPGAPLSAEDGTCDARPGARACSVNRNGSCRPAGNGHSLLYSNGKELSGGEAVEKSGGAIQRSELPDYGLGNKDDNGVRGKRNIILREVPSGSGTGGGKLSGGAFSTGDPALYEHHRMTTACKQPRKDEWMVPEGLLTDIDQSSGVRSLFAAEVDMFSCSGPKVLAGEGVCEAMENRSRLFGRSGGSAKALDDKARRLKGVSCAWFRQLEAERAVGARVDVVVWAGDICCTARRIVTVPN